MSQNRLGNLVYNAKGEDRSYREYQEDCGIDAATISKIVNGKYIPQNPEIYRKLTSKEASPRNGVTYEQLIEAAHYSDEYKKGMLAGAATTQAAMTAVGSSAALAMMGLPGVGIVLAGTSLAMGALNANKTIKKKQELDKVEKILEKMNQFVAIANGLVFSSLAQKGILFQQNVSSEIRFFENQFDTYLIVSNAPYESYVLRYVYIEETERNNKELIENTVKRLIEELVFCSKDNKRKISIVVNCKKAYEILLSYQNKLSLAVNLSVIYVDTKKVAIFGEQWIVEDRGYEK